MFSPKILLKSLVSAITFVSPHAMAEPSPTIAPKKRVFTSGQCQIAERVHLSSGADKEFSLSRCPLIRLSGNERLRFEESALKEKSNPERPAGEDLVWRDELYHRPFAHPAAHTTTIPQELPQPIMAALSPGKDGSATSETASWGPSLGLSSPLGLSARGAQPIAPDIHPRKQNSGADPHYLSPSPLSMYRALRRELRQDAALESSKSFHLPRMSPGAQNADQETLHKMHWHLRNYALQLMSGSLTHPSPDLSLALNLALLYRAPPAEPSELE